jgi:hypothetical protein
MDQIIDVWKGVLVILWIKKTWLAPSLKGQAIALVALMRTQESLAL